MYLAHFGLQELPFGLTPDTSYFFAAQSAQAALNTLLVACRAGEGFIKITGEIGTGKTMLCRKFLASLPEPFFTAYIPNPMLEPRSLMLAFGDELGLALPERIEQHILFKSINLRLLQLAEKGKRVVLCLDEAQAMPLASLEAIRLLTNLETEKRKLLQIVLFGQPELDRKLARQEIRQLAQRISFQDQLHGLSLVEVRDYIAHRCQIAGWRGPGALFDDGALQALHAASKGTPRLLNILAHKSLMVAFGAGLNKVAAAQVCAASRDTPASEISRWQACSSRLASRIPGFRWQSILGRQLILLCCPAIAGMALATLVQLAQAGYGL